MGPGPSTSNPSRPTACRVRSVTLLSTADTGPANDKTKITNSRDVALAAKGLDKRFILFTPLRWEGTPDRLRRRGYALELIGRLARGAGPMGSKSGCPELRHRTPEFSLQSTLRGVGACRLYRPLEKQWESPILRIDFACEGTYIYNVWSQRVLNYSQSKAVQRAGLMNVARQLKSPSDFMIEWSLKAASGAPCE